METGRAIVRKGALREMKGDLIVRNEVAIEKGRSRSDHVLSGS